ncbi:MAG: restriction endonuclease subunit S [Phycisphaerales bacterium]|nr:restriction endonuclease subunit S [Phycisphaerales bacterium]
MSGPESQQRQSVWPCGWALSPIDELFEPLGDGRKLHHGWSPQCETGIAGDDEWGVLKTTAVQDGAFLPEHNKRLPAKLKPRAQFEVRKGDVLITCAGPRVRCGVPCLVRETRSKLILSGKMYRFRVRPECIDSRYMEAYLRSPETQRLIDAMKTGISDSGLNLTHGRFFQLRVPVAPLREQRRIVAKIEELFSDLDAGVAALERVRANLKRYRAAVLKAAIEGRLTEAWRTRNPATEPAAKLLERIVADRRAKWEQDQLRKFKEKGKTPPKGWKEKYEQPSASTGEDAKPLPSSWCWATMEQLTTDGPQNGVYYPKSLYGRGTPIIRIDDYQNTWSRASDELQLVDTPPKDMETYGVRPGDIIINRVNSMTHLGKCLVVESKHVPAVFESNMMRQSLTTDVLPPFVAHYLKSNVGNARLIANAKWAVNQASINQTDVGNTPVPLPPLAEQSEIVAEVDRRLSVADAAEVQVEHALQRAARLRQSILKRAFEGRLVDQDPSDEPAAALLERMTIQHDRRTAGTGRPANRHRYGRRKPPVAKASGRS